MLTQDVVKWQMKVNLIVDIFFCYLDPPMPSQSTLCIILVGGNIVL